MKTKQKKGTDIIIIGMGLMGASLAMALRKKYKKKRIIGVSRSKKKIAAAKRKDIITDGGTDISACCKNAELVIVATPVKMITRFIEAVDCCAPQGAIVTDLGSTKKELVLWADQKRFKNIVYVGSHPLAGSHLSGMDAAIEGLYKGPVCFVTPSKKSSCNALQYMKRFWKNIGSRVITMPAETHDALLAASSHFPHLLAFALVGSTAKHSRKALQFVGTGFKDTTRIAGSDPVLWHDIIASNKRNMIRENKRFIRELERLNTLMQSNDTRALLKYLQSAQRVRRQLES